MKRTVTNPWSKSQVEIDLTEIDKDRFDGIVNLMDDGIRESLNYGLAPCSRAVFLAAYIDAVGPDKAGELLLS